MALSKDKGAKPEQKPAFEQEPEGGDTAVAEKPPVSEAPAAAPAPASAVAVRTTSTALSVDEAAKKASQFKKEVEDMKGAGDFSYGNYDVYKGDNGEITMIGGDETSMGRWAQVRMLSWDDHYEVSPGEQGKETKEFVAYSKDGEIVDSVIGEDQKSWVGKKVADYVDYLKKEEEFENAGKRRFIDIACAVLAADTGEDAPIGKVIQVTLSQSSIPAFSKYQEDLKNTARCVAMGLPGFALPDDPFTFFFIREKASKGDKTWTKLKISATLPNKL